MKLKTLSIPIALVAGSVGYTALHPGLAYSEPRLVAGQPTLLAQEQKRYTIDPMHTNVYFEITHMGLSRVHGRINKFTGKIIEDEKDPSKSSVEFTGETASIDTAVPPRDEHLRGRDYFEVEKYPELSFQSKKVSRSKNGYIVTGDLTIKNRTKEISIPFKHYGPRVIKGAPGEPTQVGIVADPITIKRSDFGVGSTDKLPDGIMPLSDEVTLRISLEATRDK